MIGRASDGDGTPVRAATLLRELFSQSRGASGRRIYSAGPACPAEPMRKSISVRMRPSIAVAVIALGSACREAPAADPRVVGELMRAMYGTIRVERMSPPVASRLMSYTTVALYGGFVAADPGLPSLDGALNGMPAVHRASRAGELDGTLTALAATRVVVDSLLREALPTSRASLARLADSLAAARTSLGVVGASRARSDSVGRQLGLSIVRWAHTDGFDATRTMPPFVVPVGPGRWINDAPASTFATQSLSGTSDLVTPANPANQLRGANSSDRALILSRPKSATVKSVPAVNMSGMSEPYWGTVRPFALVRWDECPIAEPPAYSTNRSSPMYRNAQEVWDVKAALTPEQRTIALYWADNAGESGTPVGHWISIASQMVSERHLSAADGARAEMFTAVAMADAFIASWGYKYQYTLLRPRTYIRRLIDPAWEPLIPTPPFPEYPSGHSTQSAAAATVLAGLIGDGAFDDSTSISIGHAVRRFPSFRAAADEAGLSRVYGGIHYPAGNLSGRELGTCIGKKVVARAGGTASSSAR